MRKNKLLFIILILVLVASLGVFSACHRTEVPTSGDVDGEVIGVSAGMGTVYNALLAADGSVGQNMFFLSSESSYRDGEKVYDITLSAAFDLTSDNVANDTHTELLLRVMEGTKSVFGLYYREGILYVDVEDFDISGKVSGVNLAKIFEEWNREKTSGTVQSVIELIPTVASCIFDGCKYYYTEETKASRYVFSLSYSMLFSSLGELLEESKIGISSVELLAALHITDAVSSALIEKDAHTTVEFALSDGAFVSAKAESDSKAFELNSFTLARNGDAVRFPIDFSVFEEFDLRNFYIKSGKAQLSFDHDEGTYELGNYGIMLNRLFVELSYPFEYSIATHYVPKEGKMEGALTIRDHNEKNSSFILKNGYLYVDLSAYDIAKCKIAWAELVDRASAVGFENDNAYEFKDKLRLAALVAAGVKKDGDVVTCTFGKEIFDLLFEKLGFRGIFGVNEGKMSWSVANNRVTDFSASFVISGMKVTLKNEYERFAFGAPNSEMRTMIALPEDYADYADLAENTSTHVSLTGKITQQNAFANAGEMVSVLVGSLAGESMTFSAEGNELTYSADIQYGASGAVEKALIYLASKGTEILRLYYTAEDGEVFYLIYPPDALTTVRPVRRLVLAEAPFAAFNAALGLDVVLQNKRLYLTPSEKYFTVGANAGLATWMLSLLRNIHSDLSCSWMEEMAYQRIDLRFYVDKMEGKVVFDSAKGKAVTVVADSFSVRFNDVFKIVSVEVENTRNEVSLFEENTMPTYAYLTFSEGMALGTMVSDTKVKVSLEGAWTYPTEQVPTLASGGIKEVTAKAKILAESVERILKVDCTALSSSAVSLVQVAGETSYNANKKTFTFARYGTKKPSQVISLYNKIILNESSTRTILWNMGEAAPAAENGQADLTPVVKSFFGNYIPLGITFKLIIEGNKIADLADKTPMVFYAYHGQDPFSKTSYPSTLNVVDAEGESLGAVTVGKWELNVADAQEIKRLADAGRLYDCDLSGSVYALFYDCLYDLHKTPQQLSVSISCKPKKLPEDYAFDFSGMNDRTDVYYNKTNHTFYFNVLYVNTLSNTSWDRLLPTTLLVDNEVFFSGVRWVFTTVENVANAEGKAGDLRMKVGDSISGFQYLDFKYCFPPVTVTSTALLSEDGEVIEEKNTDVYSYLFEEDINAFTYSDPVAVKVFYTYTQKSGSTFPKEWPFGEIEPVVLPFTTGFEPAKLFAGGRFEASRAIGSETLTVTFALKNVSVFGYDFITEEDTNNVTIASYVSADGTVIPESALLYKEDNKKKRLFFSVFDALEGGLRFYEEKSYPSVIRLYFDNKYEVYADVEVDRWDLSAIKAKSDIVTKGFRDTVFAYARGWEIEVNVSVTSAIGTADEVYTDSASSASPQTLNLRLLAADGNKGYVVIDPRDAKNYPTKLYVKRKTDDSYVKELNIVKWEGIEAVATLYQQQLKNEVAVNMVQGSVLCTVTLGNASVGYDNTQKITVNILPTYLENLDVTGIPLSVFSEWSENDSADAIKRIEGSGTRQGTATSFSYAFSLELNPYYVSPVDVKSYPRYLTFELNGLPVTADAVWDLSGVSKDAAKEGNNYSYEGLSGRYGYPVYADIEIGAGLPNIRVGVEVNIKTCRISEVKIDNSTARSIYINPYDDAPFREKKMIGTEAYIDVLVKFEGDTHDYPLELHYNTEGISLAYDGSGYKENVTVYVGNENGGYQGISGYTVRVIATPVSQISVVREDESLAPFYVKKESDGIVTDEFPTVPSLIATLATSEKMPALKVTIGDTTYVVHEYRSEEAKNEGLVYAWFRNESQQLGVRLWNSNVSEALRGVADGSRKDQEIINKNHAGDQEEVTTDLIFDKNANFDALTYGDTLSTYLTPKKVLDYFAAFIKTDIIEEKYQRRVLKDSSGMVIEDQTKMLHAGTYTIDVTVEGDGLYKGTAEKEFTIGRKDITEEVRVFVDGAYQKNAFTNGLTYNRARGYVITADGPAALLVNEQDSVILSAVKYDKDNETVLSYTIRVTSKNRDYAVGVENVGKVFEIKINETGLRADDVGIKDIAWNEALGDFTYTVSVKLDDNDIIELRRVGKDEKLTSGYKVSYYYDEKFNNPCGEELEAGDIYAKIEIKINNYYQTYRRVAVTVPERA